MGLHLGKEGGDEAEYDILLSQQHMRYRWHGEQLHAHGDQAHAVLVVVHHVVLHHLRVVLHVQLQ